MVHFFFLLDTIPCNALTMYAIKHGKPLGKISTFDIGWDVIMSLVKPFIEIRPTVGLEIGLLAKFKLFLGEMLMRAMKLKLMNNLGLAKQSRIVIFVYSIFLDKIKRKRRTLKKS